MEWVGGLLGVLSSFRARAREWAVNHFGKEQAFVIGAAIDLGYCLNLTDSSSADILREGYELLKYRCELTSNQLPENKQSKKTAEVLVRHLDCAVIQQIHDYNRDSGKQMFDSVRGIFTEGNPPYPGAAFQEKTHVQLCICNPNCIKGYFAPIQKNDDYPMP